MKTSKAPPAPFVETLLRLGRAEVDDLPYGLVLLDEAGTILLYNRYEAAMSRRPPEAVLGKNWFHEVAPCTRVNAFYGRFREFLTGGEPSIAFWFWFHFLHGSQLVDVVFLRSPDPRQVLLTVTRRVATLPDGAARSLPAELDDEAGALRAPFGAALPLPPDLLEMGLAGLAPAERRHTGEELGRRLAAAADDLARRELGRPLRSLEALLAVGLVDRTFAGAGLGRVALDATPGAARPALVLRPPAPAGPLVGELYEGAVERVASYLAGRPLTAEWADGDAPERVPWRFELAPSAGPASPAHLEEGELADGAPPEAGSVGALFADGAAPA
jgi:photoactive yellow protein